jgi:hypothetical protein
MLENEKNNRFTDQRERQDQILGLLFLKADFFDLKFLEKLPDVLEHKGLIYARAALLYALGYEDHLRSEQFIPIQEDGKAVKDFFASWLNQPAKNDLPEKPEFLRAGKVTFKSFVLGCEIKFEVENTLNSIYLSEAILAALESLLSTSLDAPLLPYREELEIRVKPSEFVGTVPQYKIEKAGGDTKFEISHPPVILFSSIPEQKVFSKWLFEVVLVIVSEIALSDDFEKHFDKLSKDETAFDRALNFALPSVFIGNMLGSEPKFNVNDWPSEESKRFALKRDLPWSHWLPVACGRDEKPPIAFEPGEGEPESLFGIDNLKHRDRRVLSVINTPLWNEAKWKATAYMYHPDSQAPPMLILGFQKPGPAKLIFKSWCDRFGSVDTSDQLSISIVKGIDKAAPASYKVIIGSIPKSTIGVTAFVMVTRYNRMDPPDTRNLDLFLRQFEQKKRYILAPGHFKDSYTKPDIFIDLGIEKHKLNVKQAWEIGQNDLEICALSEDDDPIIPEGIKNPPVLIALKSISKRRKLQSF